MDRIYTGFKSIDKYLKIHKGDLVVVGARPAIGKTCLICSMMEKTMDKQKILFFSMKTNKHKAVDRLELLNVKEKVNFHLCDSLIGYEEMLLLVAEHKIKYNIDVVFINNALDLFNNTVGSENETSIKLKNLAEKLNVAVIIADRHNITRKRRSCYLDLRHKSLIKYADKIITINRPDLRATEKEFIDGLVEINVAEIIIDKDIEEDYVPWINLKFDNNNLCFNEISKKH